MALIAIVASGTSITVKIKKGKAILSSFFKIIPTNNI
jgi:hypothetical protein